MNERIKELAEQAHKYAANDPRANITVSYVSIFEEKFAELVRQDERNLRRTKKEWSDYERAIAADEREACAKLCDDLDRKWNQSGVRECAAAIRGRAE